MLVAANWVQRDYFSPGNLDVASLINFIRLSDDPYSWSMHAKFFRQRFFEYTRIAAAYQSELLETEPFILALANCRVLVVGDENQTMQFWTGLCTWFERALHMFQAANRLYVTEERGDANFGPLVEDLISIKNGSNMLNFTEEEVKQIEEQKTDFAMVAGVRRQAACITLKQIEALGLCKDFKIEEESKPVVKQVSRVLAQFVIKQGQHLDSKIKFGDKHQETLSQELDQSKANAMIE